MLVGSVSNGLNSLGGLRAGLCIVVNHQGISDSFLRINILRNTPFILSALQENVREIRAVLDRIDTLTIPSHATSPSVHIYSRSATPSLSAAALNQTTPDSRDAPFFDIVCEERLLQDIVNKVLVQGV